MGAGSPGWRLTALAAAAAAMGSPAAAQEPLLLPEPEPAALNCGYAALSSEDMAAATQEIRAKLLKRARTPELDEKGRDERSLAAGKRCAQQFGFSRRRTQDLGTYAALKLTVDYLRTSLLPEASRVRIERTVLGFTSAEVLRMTTKGNKGDGDLAARLMQAVFSSETPATEQSVEQAMLYAGSLVLMRRARLDWAAQDAPAAARAR